MPRIKKTRRVTQHQLMCAVKTYGRSMRDAATAGTHEPEIAAEIREILEVNSGRLIDLMFAIVRERDELLQVLEGGSAMERLRLLDAYKEMKK